MYCGILDSSLHLHNTFFKILFQHLSQKGQISISPYICNLTVNINDLNLSLFGRQ